MMREDRRLLAALPVWANRMRSDLLMLLLDAALVSLSLMAILLIRDGGPPNPDTWRQALGFLPVVIAVFLVVGWAFGVYRHVWRYASVYEARRLIEAGTVSMAVLCVTVLATHRQFGPRTIIASSALATLLIGAVRFQSRLFSRRRVEESEGGLRVVLVGAGPTGAALARQMLTSRGSGLVPVCFVDDDPRMQGKQVLGVSVRGYTTDLATVIASEEAHQVLLAVPSAPGIWSNASPAPPSWREWLCASSRRSRRSSAPDCVCRTSGRSASTTCSGASRWHRPRRRRRAAQRTSGARHRRRRVDRLGDRPPGRGLRPGALVLLDHDETHLHDAAPRHCDAPSRAPCSADIRDRQRLHRRSSTRHRPEVVFHAAAHKHVPMLEDAPVRGRHAPTCSAPTTCVDAAAAVGVERLRAHLHRQGGPTRRSVMGATKWVAEQSCSARRRDREPGSPRCASATCSAAAAASSRRSSARSPPAARSPSPTRR